ncbi:hypothetical protein J5N97_014742 [Dioscorea zingiberensis]|uniref:PLAC8 family protein n=1 Tax=Dioscorea zingiberensis TaxID=325984 RepID=A0A9D5CVR5_9LILI|nr:hypothetical protein J5N97_014742 [Dioscorea zingiberensis]
MVAAANVMCRDEIQEESKSSKTPNSDRGNSEIPLYVRTSQRGLLGEKNRRSKFRDVVTAFTGRARQKKIGSQNPPPSKFQRVGDERDEKSFSVASPTDQSSSKHFHVPFIRKIDWASLWVLCKEWIRNPFNMALFAWITFVAISGAILFLVMTGMLNGVLTKKSQRDTWFEVNNQILNALFTLMCLYQHPKRFHNLVLLCRWRPDDVLRLRKIYCKNGAYKPNERMHMMVVLFFLHLNCFAQYALCGLNLGYPRSQRPAVGVGLCVSVAMSAPAIASVYNILSPLGKDYEVEKDQEAQSQTSVAGSKPNHMKSLQKKYSFMSREDNRIAESNPQWIGSLFDLWDDISLAYLSLFCSCCVFGWNMDRLGFGNMYVHIVTFILFCLAPFFIFNLAAVNIDNEGVREALGIAGFLLCIFGLLYGGFWRIQMRKRYKLPGNDFCCGKPSVTDCFQWLCCCPCSLAQEVRTADYYDIGEDNFYLKQSRDDGQLMLSPLPREDGSTLFKSGPSSPFHSNASPLMFKMNNGTSPTRSPVGYTSDSRLPVVEEHPSAAAGDKDHTMTPPAPSFILKEDNPTA